MGAYHFTLKALPSVCLPNFNLQRVYTYHRFEFATNEYINDLACVTLETASTESGSKDFIVVGTTIDRGEDLAAKGAVRASLCPFSLIYFN